LSNSRSWLEWQSSFIRNRIFEVLLATLACYTLPNNNEKGQAGAKVRVDLEAILK
jgi:hypothetical protein